MFCKTTFSYLKKVNRTRNYVLKYNLYICFLIKQTLPISCKKIVIAEEIKEASRNSYIFLDVHLGRYNCAKFHNWMICLISFGKGAIFRHHPSVNSLKKANHEQGQQLIKYKTNYEELVILFWNLVNVLENIRNQF